MILILDFLKPKKALKKPTKNNPKKNLDSIQIEI